MRKRVSARAFSPEDLIDIWILARCIMGEHAVTMSSNFDVGFRLVRSKV